MQFKPSSYSGQNLRDHLDFFSYPSPSTHGQSWVALPLKLTLNLSSGNCFAHHQSSPGLHRLLPDRLQWPPNWFLCSLCHPWWTLSTAVRAMSVCAVLSPKRSKAPLLEEKPECPSMAWKVHITWPHLPPLLSLHSSHRPPGGSLRVPGQLRSSPVCFFCLRLSPFRWTQGLFSLPSRDC